MKKTTLALLLVLMLVLSACGENTIQTETPASTVEQTDAETAPEETKADAAPLTLGSFDGGVYTNEYLGIGCELDTSWTFNSAETLQELPENIAELLADTELAEDGLAQQIMDMKADNAETLASMNVLYTKVGLQERLVYLTMSDEEIVEATLEQADMMKDSYAQAGILVEEMKMVTAEFLGEERVALWTSSTMEGIPYYILQVFDYRAGQYGATITASSFMEDTTQQVLNLFYELS